MLALVAVTLLSLRSVCELWFTHVGGVATASGLATLAHGPLQHEVDAAVDCCSSASDPNAAALLQAAIVGPQVPQGVSAAVLVAVVVGSTMLTRQPHWLRSPPRSPQSFYLRSARILR